MITPETIRSKALQLDALAAAFEKTYLDVIEFADIKEGGVGLDERNRGCLAFYALRDMLDSLICEMEELCGHMEVCNVVLAIRSKESR